MLRLNSEQRHQLIRIINLIGLEAAAAALGVREKTLLQESWGMSHRTIKRLASALESYQGPR